jgi:hypothetical protein
VGNAVIEALGDFDFTVRALNRKNIHSILADKQIEHKFLTEISSDRNTVINCISSTDDTKPRNIELANFEIPARLFNMFHGANNSWVQCGSWFQHFEEQFGSHKNEYARYKSKMKSHVFDSASLYRYTLNVCLPHILSPLEPDSRFFRSLAESLAIGNKFSATSGAQVLPVVSLNDVVGDLLEIVRRIDGNSSEMRTRMDFGVSPTIVAPLFELARKMENLYGRSNAIKFGNVLSEDEHRHEREYAWPTKLTPIFSDRESLDDIFRSYLKAFPKIS